MENYCVGKKSEKGGVHVVHTCCCLQRPDLEEQVLLGPFSDCREAIAEARKLYGKVEGCPDCCGFDDSPS